MRNREKNGSLTYQVQQCLQSKLAIGESKHVAKSDGSFREKIYSWGTYRSYERQCIAFAKAIKTAHPEVRTLEDARQYADEYLRSRSGLSAYTQKLDVAALAKLYGCKSADFVATPDRQRRDIQRSRGEKIRDRHFSESKNAEFVEFCRATGLRRSELQALKPEQLRQEPDGNYYLQVKGKGGRVRMAPVLDNAAVQRIQGTDPQKRVWEKVPNAADVHGYRADYATRIYKQHVRPKDSIPKKDRYYCRGDLKGIVLDRQAMAIASQALGHNRISVIAGHYIRMEQIAA